MSRYFSDYKDFCTETKVEEDGTDTGDMGSCLRCGGDADPGYQQLCRDCCWVRKPSE
jgi:NMD protein affecting ribosome stability and mRNA decay